MAFLHHFFLFTILTLISGKVIIQNTRILDDISSSSYDEGHKSSIKQGLNLLDNVSKMLSKLIKDSQSKLQEALSMVSSVQYVLTRNEDHSSRKRTWRDCTEVRESLPNSPSGMYLIKPVGKSNRFQAFCDMDTEDGGWIVFQRRYNGSVDFYSNWTDYKHGFGNVNGEHWLGLDRIHQLTSTGGWQLRVDLEDHNSNTAYAKYDDFYVGNENTLYTLHIGEYNGTAYDALQWNDNFPFSTYDNDNDISKLNCAELRHSAWWYKHCTFADLNSDYSDDPLEGDRGIVWHPWMYRKLQPRFIVMTEMKARRVI